MIRQLQRRDLLRAGAGLGALAALPLAGACAPGSASRPSQGFSWNPDASAIPAAHLDRIRASVTERIEANAILGAVTLIAARDRLLHFEAHGARDPAGAPMPLDGLFRMMSSTKGVTSVAILQLVEAGRLALTDPVSRYLPTFANPKVAVAPDGWQASALDPAQVESIKAQIRLEPAEREITIKDLLTHTAGLSAAYGLGMGPASLVNPPMPGSRDVTLADRIPDLGGLALDFQPGSRFGYSPLDGMDVLLRIVEIVSGQEAEAYLKANLFEPLDMVDTSFNVPADKEDRLLTLTGFADGAWTERESALGEGWTRYKSGGAGLFSTVRDFTHFELMKLNGGVFNGRRLLSADTIRLMTTNHVGDQFAQWVPMLSAGQGFGLGHSIVLDPDVAPTGKGLGAFGWGGGYGTESWVEPGLDVVVCHFVQCATPTPPGPVPPFARAVRAALEARG